ncbi:hypothetical protein D3C80_1064350 [compost metagenome]
MYKHVANDFIFMRAEPKTVDRPCRVINSVVEVDKCEQCGDFALDSQVQLFDRQLVMNGSSSVEVVNEKGTIVNHTAIAQCWRAGRRGEGAGECNVAGRGDDVCTGKGREE